MAQTYGHRVIQKFQHNSINYLRVQYVKTLDNFHKLLRDTYDEQGEIEINYYAEPLTTVQIQKLISYVELMFSAQVVKSNSTGVVFRLDSEDLKPEITTLLDRFGSSCNYDDYILQGHDSVKEITIKKYHIEQLEIDYSKILDKLQTVDSLQSPIHFEIKEFVKDDHATHPYIVPYQVLTQFIRSALHKIGSFDIPQLDKTTCDTSKWLMVGNEIRVINNKVEIPIIECIQVLKDQFIGSASFETKMKSLLDNIKWSNREMASTPCGNFDNPLVSDYDPYECTFIHDVNFLNFSYVNNTNDQTYGVTPTTINKPTRDQIIVFKQIKENIVLPHPFGEILNQTPAITKRVNISLVANLITKEKVVTEDIDSESLVESLVLDTCSCASDQVEKFKSSLDSIIDCIDNSEISIDTLLRFATKLLLPVSNGLDEPELLKCKCNLCVNNTINSLEQHTLIEHFVSVADIKSSTQWCMSSDLLNCIEQYICGINEQTSLKCKINRNCISQSLAEFLEKKRRVTGMTFNCELPSHNSIKTLIDETATIIKQKYK